MFHLEFKSLFPVKAAGDIVGVMGVRFCRFNGCYMGFCFCSSERGHGRPFLSFLWCHGVLFLSFLTCHGILFLSFLWCHGVLFLSFLWCHGRPFLSFLWCHGFLFLSFLWCHGVSFLALQRLSRDCCFCPSHGVMGVYFCPSSRCRFVCLFFQ